MSNNTLVAKIKADAEEKAVEIAKVAETEVSAISKDTEAKLKALQDSHAAELEKQNKHLELVTVSRAKQSGKIALQQAKRDQIDAIFAAAVEELVSQPAESYVSYFAKQVKEIVPEGAKVTKVLAPESRQDETKKILSEAGLSGDVESVSGMTAGLVIETEDGIYDATLDRLMNVERAQIEMEIVKEVMN